MKPIIFCLFVSAFLMSCGNDLPIPTAGVLQSIPNHKYNIDLVDNVLLPPTCKSTGARITVTDAGYAAAIHHFKDLTSRTYEISNATFTESYVGGACTINVTRNIIGNKAGTLELQGKTYTFTPTGCGLQTNSTTPTTYNSTSLKNDTTSRLFYSVTSFLDSNVTKYRLEGNIFDLTAYGCRISDQFVQTASP